jgi:drug/metabolite transporter (DMT)-like permease
MRLRNSVGRLWERTWHKQYGKDTPLIRLFGLVAATIVCFAGNSLLCREALGHGTMDPATFTFLRLCSGAVVLALLSKARGGDISTTSEAGYAGAVSLFAYAALFSWAYVRIAAGVGALVLFAFVQLTMLASAVRSGTGPRGVQWLGVAIALAGVAVLALPGATAPDPVGVVLMAGSGVAWGVYSLLGRRVATPLAVTTASFVRAVPLALGALLLAVLTSAEGPRWNWRTLGLSLASGGLASGLGYTIWYTALPRLDATRAAVVQLAVPLLAATGGIVLLGEKPTIVLGVAAVAILGGMVLTIVGPGVRGPA